MKKIVFVLLLTSVLTPGLCWGPNGHRATGHIANKYLSKKARKAVERILRGQSLAMASTWMDEVRSDTSYNHMTDWHWVTVPDGQAYAQAEKNPNGDIIETIQRVVADLKSGKLSGQKEAEALKILIHLVGDIHQPLHVGTGNDRGGNDVRVQWFRSNSNLHRVWDSDMIEGTQLSYTELAESLDKPADSQVETWQKSNVLDWAQESMSMRKQVYDIGDGNLGYQYSYKYFDLVKLRLLQSGVRLAGILNEIYG